MSVDSREFVRTWYARHADGYDGLWLADRRGRIITANDYRIVHELIGDVDRSADVLEVAAGTGRFTRQMLEWGFTVTATDIIEAMLKHLRSKVEEGGFGERCTIRHEDLFQLSFADASFDLVYGMHVIPRLMTLVDQRSAIAELGRVVRPGGRLLFNFRNAAAPIARFRKGHHTRPEEVVSILADAGCEPVAWRGKWLLNRTLADRLPRAVVAALAAADRRLFAFRPQRAWDVFVLARKA